MPSKNKLSLFDTTMLVTSLVIGMGIFFNPSLVAISAKTPTIFYAAWLVGGIISFFGALTYAEIGSRYTVRGGYYKICSYCYHPAYAFMVNWMIVISNAGANAAVAIAGSQYIVPVILPESFNNPLGVKYFTVGIIIFLFLINYLGIKISARLQNVLSVVKIGMILVLCLSVFFMDGHTPKVQSLPPILSGYSDYLGAFCLSFIPIFFTYGGYQQIINFGADIENPRRNTPLGTFLGFMIVMALYLLINYAYVRGLGFEGVQQTKSLAADLAAVFFGEKGFKIVSILLFFSVLSFINSSMLSNPRVYFAMADDGVLPKVFRQTNEKTQVQEFSLAVFAIFLIVVLFFFETFKDLLSYVMFFDSIGMVSTAATIFILRRRADNVKEGIFQLSFGKNIIPALFIFIYAVVAITALWSSPQNVLKALLLFSLGMPIYWFMKKVVVKT